MDKHAEFESYFRHRGVSAADYADYRLPAYLSDLLPADKNARILDFGCGYGQGVRALIAAGYRNAVGYDIEPGAIDHCLASGIPVIDGRSLPGGLPGLERDFDMIVTNHVLEHIPKSQVVAVLTDLRQIMAPQGVLFVAVPNAQSATGCYWAYEDFTHETLFTSGSLYYVLSKAGFSQISFVDPDCLRQAVGWKRLVRKALLAFYRRRYRFWNMVTGSAIHAPSLPIFSYEVKATARS